MKMLDRKGKSKGTQDFQLLLKSVYKGAKISAKDDFVATMHAHLDKEMTVSHLKTIVEDFSCRTISKENPQTMRDLFQVVNDVLMHYSMRLRAIVRLEDDLCLLHDKQKFNYKKLKMTDALTIVNYYNGDLGSLVQLVLTVLENNEVYEAKVAKAARKSYKDRSQQPLTVDDKNVIATDDVVQANTPFLERFHITLFAINGGGLDLKFTTTFTPSTLNKILIVVYEFGNAVYARQSTAFDRPSHPKASVLDDFWEYTELSTSRSRNPRRLLKLLETHLVPDFHIMERFKTLNKHVADFYRYLVQKHDQMMKKLLLEENIMKSEWYPQLKQVSLIPCHDNSTAEGLIQHMKKAFTKDKLHMLNSNLNSLKSCNETEYEKFMHIHLIVQELLEAKPIVEERPAALPRTHFDGLVDKISVILVTMARNIFKERSLEDKKACYWYLNELKQDVQAERSKAEFSRKQDKLADILNFVDLLSCLENKTITTENFIIRMRKWNQKPNNPEYVDLVIEKAKQTDRVIEYIISAQEHIVLLGDLSYSEKLFYKFVQELIEVSKVG